MDLFNESFRLAAMDPGGDTGLALLNVRPQGFHLEEWSIEPYRPGETTPIQKLRRWRESKTATPFVLVYENFHVRPGVAVPDTTALEIIGELSAWLDEEPPSEEERSHWPFSLVVPQEPAQAKKLVTDEVLSRLNLKVRGKDSRHARDALRHAVTWLALKRYMPLCRKAWPRLR